MQVASLRVPGVRSIEQFCVNGLVEAVAVTREQ